MCGCFIFHRNGRNLTVVTHFGAGKLCNFALSFLVLPSGANIKNFNPANRESLEKKSQFYVIFNRQQ